LRSAPKQSAPQNRIWLAAPSTPGTDRWQMLRQASSKKCSLNLSFSAADLRQQQINIGSSAKHRGIFSSTGKAKRLCLLLSESLPGTVLLSALPALPFWSPANSDPPLPGRLQTSPSCRHRSLAERSIRHTMQGCFGRYPAAAVLAAISALTAGAAVESDASLWSG